MIWIDVQLMMFRRKEPIIAIGGGVCLDVAGLTANLYRRNTPVIKVRLLPSDCFEIIRYQVPACGSDRSYTMKEHPS